LLDCNPQFLDTARAARAINGAVPPEINSRRRKRQIAMLRTYIPILLFVLVAIGFAVFTLLVARLVHAEKPNAVKLEPYECGIEPQTDARDRYSIRYYLVAMLFVIFEVETIFMFPWAVALDRLALFGLIEMLVFLFILVVGYAWAWKRGALEWQ
jgi:NADH-quinone oxidoreductase subunit A